MGIDWEEILGEEVNLAEAYEDMVAEAYLTEASYEEPPMDFYEQNSPPCPETAPLPPQQPLSRAPYPEIQDDMQDGEDDEFPF